MQTDIACTNHNSFPLRDLKKRGFLFTIMTLILLMPILMIAMMHFESEEREAAYTNRLIFAKRISYIMDDISYDIKTMNEYDVYFSYDYNKSQVNVANLTVYDRTNINNDLTSYFTGLYSNITNQNLSVQLNNSIQVFRNNTKIIAFSFGNGSFNASSLDGLEAIDITIRSLQIGTLNSTGSPTGGIGIPVHVRIEDYYTNSQLDQTRILTISALNSAFYVMEGQRFINVSIANNSISIISNMSIEVKSMTLNLSSSDILESYTGNITFQEYQGLKKEANFRIG